jgi:hypothetical protein
VKTTAKPELPADFIEDNGERVILRADYRLTQPDGLPTVREYVIVERDGQRFLLLRWGRDCSLMPDHMTLEVEQLSAVGTSLGVSRVTYTASDLPMVERGESFILPCGIPVELLCTDVKVSLTEARHGACIFQVEGTRVTESYRPEEPWQYDPRGGEKVGLSDSTDLSVRSLKNRKVTLLWPVALAVLLTMVLLMILPCLPKKNGRRETLSAVPYAHTAAISAHPLPEEPVVR